ncbi:MAG: DUF3726 domain-containing protein [Proteobacteria bacterium]|nr:DUF3726 domain-containing protein [Pseudomonadota bacterium]
MTGRHGPVPLNEIRFVFGRAGFGAGLPWGLAEDFAEACIRLTRAGIDPGPAAAAALVALDEGSCGRGVDLEETSEAVTLRAEGVLSALHAGPAAGDWLACNRDGPKALRLAAVDCPLLILGSLAGPAHPPGRWAISWRALSGGAGDSAIIGAEGALHLGPEAAARLAAAGPANIDIAPADQEPETAVMAPPDVFESGVWIDAGSWTAIMAFFGCSLVPSTEADRLAGAGAGLVDTD